MERNQKDLRISPSPQTTQDANAPQSPQPLHDPTISPRRLTRKISGFIPVLCGLMLIGSIPLFIFGAVLLDEEKLSGGIFMALAALMLIVSLLLIIAIKSVKPNEAAVFTLFGNYYGTIDQPGLYLLNPFVSSVTDPARKSGTEKKSKDAAEPSIEINIPTGRLSLKVKTLNNERQKVNDLLGNPVILETVVFWRIVDPTKAVFNVDNYFEFLSTQCDSVVRNIARLYPYDNLEFDDIADSEKTLMGSSQVIADEMQRALQEKMHVAGIFIEDVRISHLAYAEEIAAAMLQRQQASAVVSARSKIVDGAVGMVEMALAQLDEKHLVALDEERKAQMVSNLLVVLCASKEVAPIVNSGSIY